MRKLLKRVKSVLGNWKTETLLLGAIVDFTSSPKVSSWIDNIQVQVRALYNLYAHLVVNPSSAQVPIVCGTDK